MVFHFLRNSSYFLEAAIFYVFFCFICVHLRSSAAELGLKKKINLPQMDADERRWFVYAERKKIKDKLAADGR